MPRYVVVGDVGWLVDATADAVAHEVSADRVSVGQDGGLDRSPDGVERHTCAGGYESHIKSPPGAGSETHGLL
jgi:hypothetical protein